MPNRKSVSILSQPQSVPLAVTRAILDAEGPPRAELWAEHFADGIHLRVANRPVVRGRDRAVLELAALFKGVVAIGRQFCFIWPASDGETALTEADLIATHFSEPLPLVIVLRALEPAPLVRDLRFYLDPAPLGMSSPAALPNGQRRMN